MGCDDGGDYIKEGEEPSKQCLLFKQKYELLPRHSIPIQRRIVSATLENRRSTKLTSNSHLRD